MRNFSRFITSLFARSSYGIAFAAILGSQFAQAVVDENHFMEGQFQIGSGFRYVKTDSNYASFGSETVLNGVNRGYSSMDLDLTARYVLIDRWGLHGNLVMSNAESTNTDATRKNSNLASVSLGTDILFLYGSHFLWGDVNATLPVDKFDKNADNPLTSDGVVSFATTLNYLKPFRNWTFEGGLGFKYRLEGRSALMPYNAGASYHFGKWYLGGGFSGFQSVINDADTDSQIVRNTTLTRANGGSLIYSSINPAAIFAELKVGRLSQGSNHLEGIVRTTLAGDNYAAYTEGLVRWFWYFGYERDPKSLEKRIREIPTEFEADTQDGVDQSLFENNAGELPRKAVRKNVEAFEDESEPDDADLLDEEGPEPTIQLKKKKRPTKKIKKKKKRVPNSEDFQESEEQRAEDEEA